MSKKDYIALARAISEARPDGFKAQAVKDVIASNIADACAADSPRFDRERFLRAALQGDFTNSRKARCGAMEHNGKAFRRCTLLEAHTAVSHRFGSWSLRDDLVRA